MSDFTNTPGKPAGSGQGIPFGTWSPEPRHASVGHLFTTLWPETSALPWRTLCIAALERDALDGVDVSLILTLSNLCDGSEDLPLLLTLGCLCSTVKTGALRLRLTQDHLASALRDWLCLDLDKHPDLPLFDGKTPAQLGHDWARNFRMQVETGRYDRILGKPPEYKPLLLHDDSLYFQKHFAAEASVGNALGKRLVQSRISTTHDVALHYRSVLEEVLSHNPLLRTTPSGPLPLRLAPEQQAALALALRGPLLVVSGGPGTGKTTLIAALLRVMTRAIPLDVARIRLAAPTGRAAHRLGESLRESYSSLEASGRATPTDIALGALTCSTLHRLLGYNPVTGRFRHTRSNPIDADLIVVDEVSMVDIFMLARLLEALRPETRLVLVGDRHQLPSVDSGAVLADLLPEDEKDYREEEGTREWIRACGLEPPDSPHALPNGFSVALARSHRSAEGILEAAVLINQNAPENSSHFRATLNFLEPRPFSDMGAPVGPGQGGNEIVTPGCRLLLAPDNNYRAHRDKLLSHWVNFHYPEKSGHGACIRKIASLTSGSPELSAELDKAFAGIDRARILTLTRKGPFGCETVNRRIRNLLLGSSSRKFPQSGEGFPGAPILILENDYRKQLYNGDVGLIVNLSDRQIAVFRGADGFAFYPIPFLPRFELAFATTVHKSQGSEYAHVLLLLPEKDGKLCYREAVYTAITRAKFFAGIYGSPEILEQALKRQIRRNSGLRKYFLDPPQST